MSTNGTTEANPPSPARLGSAVYEVVDATTEENYWTLGMFATLDDAIRELENCTPDDLPGERNTDDECCHVEVYEHHIGQWSGHGRKVYECSWNVTYNEESDDIVWVRVAQNT